MSEHYSNYVTPSSPPSKLASPTTSTELLIAIPHRQTRPMQEPKHGETSSAGSSSTVKRSHTSPRQPNPAGRDEIEESQSQNPTIYCSPQNPPSAHLHSSHVSNDTSRRISPSALEAGYAKEQDPSQHVSRTATGDEKRVRVGLDGTTVWPPWKREDGWVEWRSEWVKKEALVVPLVVQAFSAGVLDATTYADFMTFASNQTGNTILLCVSVAGTVSGIIKLTAISLGAFLSAAFIFGHLGHYFGVRQRGWILMTTTWQIIILLVAAILCSPHGPPIFHIGGQHDWFILFLFAHMSGAQVAQARQSSNQELPTAPMTSSYVDLMSEKYLFVGFRHKKAGPRNRKLAYTSSMIIGGLLGAVIHKFAGSWEVVVVTMMLKVVMLGLVCRAKTDEDKDI